MNTGALPASLLEALRADPVIGDPIDVEPMTGGVSSDVWLVRTMRRQLVVKLALPTLRVSDAWHADTSRNAVERAYLEYAKQIVPDAVPTVLAGDREAGWFAMEFFGEGYANWKQHLLAGDTSPVHAIHAGHVLGRIHRASWADPAVAARFDTLPNFHALRLEPYLLTTAQRVPAARAALQAEAARLAATKLALVHGDYSPKNLLVSPSRLVVLDAECGWFGDPAFDPAFLLNHLLLKSLLHASQPAGHLALIPAFWSAYIAALGEPDPELERRTTRLLLGLMLARVHGKSPAEYLTQPVQRALVTDFALLHLPRPPETVAALAAAWRDALVSL